MEKKTIIIDLKKISTLEFCAVAQLSKCLKCKVKKKSKVSWRFPGDSVATAKPA